MRKHIDAVRLIKAMDPTWFEVAVMAPLMAVFFAVLIYGFSVISAVSE